MHVVILGGAGTIGSTVAYTLALQRPQWRVTLVDTTVDQARGHALDIDCLAGHASHAAGQQTMRNHHETGIERVTAVEDLTAMETADGLDPDLIVMAASIPRPENSGHRGGRMAQLKGNMELATEIGADLAAFDPVPVIVVTNPTDRITYRLWETSPDDWNRQLFIGYSLSETARVAHIIARRHDVPVHQVRCPVMGEHGEEIVPVFSRAMAGNQTFNFDAAERAVIREQAKDIAYDVIEWRGAEETSRWLSGSGVAMLTQLILTGGSREPLCLSTPLDGAYGYRDAALGVPIQLTRTGVASIIEWDLSDEEHQQFEAAYNAVQADLERLR